MYCRREALKMKLSSASIVNGATAAIAAVERILLRETGAKRKTLNGFWKMVTVHLLQGGEKDMFGHLVASRRLLCKGVVRKSIY